MGKTNDILNAYETSLAAETGRQTIISAATPLELSKRSGVRREIFALKITKSSVATYTEAWRATDERPFFEIMCFVGTSDSHTDRDNKYKLLLDMCDEVKDWALGIANENIGVNFTKYLGAVNTVDDQPGFYARTLRLQFEQNL